MSRANTARKANQYLRNRGMAVTTVTTTDTAEESPVIAQTPEAQYEAAHGLADWYRGQCQCSQCIKEYGTSKQTLIGTYGERTKVEFEGRRVPHVACMLAVRRSWNPCTRQVVREVLGTIEYGDYLLGRDVGMSGETREIRAMTEPARIITAARVRRGDIEDAGLRVRKSRIARDLVLRGHCGICDEPKEPGKTYCMTCRGLLGFNGDDAELSKRIEAGKQRRSAR
jgi:hypothetical protein